MRKRGAILQLAVFALASWNNIPRWPDAHAQAAPAPLPVSTVNDVSEVFAAARMLKIGMRTGEVTNLLGVPLLTQALLRDAEVAPGITMQHGPKEVRFADLVKYPGRRSRLLFSGLTVAFDTNGLASDWQPNPMYHELSTNRVLPSVTKSATGWVSITVTQVIPAVTMHLPHEARIRTLLEQIPECREMAAKENLWKQNSKALKKGMTLNEVVAIMGTPTQVEAHFGPMTPQEIAVLDGETNTSTDTETRYVWIAPVRLDSIVSVTGEANAVYAPDGKPSSASGSIGEFLTNLPYAELFLRFDNAGKLDYFRWDDEK